MFHKFVCNLFLNNNRRRRDDNVWQAEKGRKTLMALISHSTSGPQKFPSRHKSVPN